MKHWRWILLAFFSFTAYAEWIDGSGKPGADTEHMRSTGTFGAQLLLTPDESEFRRAWETATSKPMLRTTDKVRRGGSISAMLIFSGCLAGIDGKCNVVAEFTTIEPTGRLSSSGEAKVWSARPVAGKLMLSHSSITLGFEAEDTKGNYRIKATIRDLIGKRELQLSKDFQVE